jgi:NTE family protein
VTRPHRLRAPSSLARFFQALVAEGEAWPFCLPGGADLFRTGEVSDRLYFLRTGRLAARIGEVNPRTVTIQPGETVGEMALLAETAHTATVYALRDSELVAAPRELFFDRARSDPDLLIDVARLVLGRTRQSALTSPPQARRVFAVMALTASLSARSFAAALADSLGRLGLSARVHAEGPATPEWFAGVEQASEFVLYAVEHDEPVWRALVARQVDGVLLLARGRDRPDEQPLEARHAPWPTAADLIVVQDATAGTPRGAAGWVAALAPERLFHVRDGLAEDIERLARTLSGRAVALVLSGGAARAYAHVGAVQVLREAGIPIDVIGGVSMGAIVGAGVAMGWDDGELDDRIRKAFVASSPIHDFALPVIAIAKGDMVRQRLAEHFGDRTIAELWRPFFCVSTNLTDGTQKIHRHGLVREALRASLSLPGVLPPVTDGEDILVDGAVLNNFPTDVMRSFHDGPIIGVDVGSGRSIGAADIEGFTSTLHWVSSGGWREGAPIVSILIRAATITAHHQSTAAHELTDVLIQPKLDEVEIGDWKAYEPAVAAGRRATLTALDALDRPVTDLGMVASQSESFAVDVPNVVSDRPMA